MKHIKRIAAAVLALCSLLALTACGGLREKVESKLWETAAPNPGPGEHGPAV